MNSFSKPVVRTNRTSKVVDSSNRCYCSLFVTLLFIAAPLFLALLLMSSTNYLEIMSGLQRNMKERGQEGIPTTIHKSYIIHPSFNKSSATNNTSQHSYLSSSTNKLLDGLPRMIISGPCSGSSITIKITKKILEAHGYNVFAGKEPTVPRRNKFYSKAVKNLRDSLKRDPSPSEIVAESFKIINEMAVKKDKILLIKLSNIREDMLQHLEDMGAKYAFTYRENVLDRVICVVRDCFQKRNLGYQVYSNGTYSDLCFDRRKSSENIMAYINNTQAMIDFMKRTKSENEARMAFYKHFVDPAKMWSYEDLFLFEYTNSSQVFDQSVEVWSSFLQNFADIDQLKLEGVLRLYQNTRSPPPHHKTLVYNMEHVSEALSSIPDLRSFIRE